MKTKKITTSSRQLKQPAIDTVTRHRFSSFGKEEYPKGEVVGKTITTSSPTIPPVGDPSFPKEGSPYDIIFATVSLCLCVLLILFAVSCGDGDPGTGTLPAETATASISPRMVTSPGHVAPHAADTRATLLYTFNENDQILVTYHNGTAERSATFTRTADGKWTTGTANEETIHINTLGTTTVEATFVQTGTDPTTDPATGITTYTDLLTEATADFADGTITPVIGADYTIILTFGHARALLVAPATINITGTGTAGSNSPDIDTGKPVYFDITTADGVAQRLEATETRMENPPGQLAPAAIAPAGPTLQAITFTLVGETNPRRATPDTPVTLAAGKQYTPAITASMANGYSFTVSEADGTIAPWTDGGAATHNYTHTIDSYEALAAFATEMNELNALNGYGATAGISALQTANITMPDDNGTGNNWTPIDRFEGLYNGNGYTITGMKVTGTATDEYTGFFRQLGSDAKIVNVHLREAAVTNNDISTSSYNGILASRADDAHIALCSVTGTVTNGIYCGGLVGVVSGTHITRSRAHCTVTTSAQNAIVGGLIGWGVTNSTIVACMADGSVTATGTGTGTTTGGLISTIMSGSKVYYCYATVTATGGSYTGTLVGYNYNADAEAIQYSYSNIPAPLLGMGNYNTDTCWQNYMGSTGTPAAIVRAGSIADVYTWTGIAFEQVTFTGNKVWTTGNDFPTLNYYTY